MRSLSFLEVFSDKTGGNTKLQTSEYQNQGLLPIIDQGRDAIAGYTDRGDAVASVDLPVIIFGDHTRAIKYVDHPFVLGADGTKVLSPRRDGDARFFFHYLRSIELPSAGYSRHYKYLKEVTVPFPSLEEQQRIAAILDKADELRAKRRQAIAHLDALTQSIFHSMFGDPVSNSQNWPLEPFGRVTVSRLGKMLDKKAQTGERSFKYLRNANVQWFEIDTSDLLEMDFSPSDQAEFALRRGDVLVCEGGEPGRAAIWRDQEKDCYFQKALHRVRPDLEVIDPQYLVHLLWSLAKGGGLKDHVTVSTIAHLTGEKLKRMRIPVPPLELQQTFATRVAAVERLKETHRKHLGELDALFTSLQSRAFKGEL
ncbi:restriction endonuclease subunit S [Paenarthrobacter sp. 4246]|uniref:restriction endonuclease subunit S n=1 Tax=Paenarthrobacter sp. 4246 TaxID=3156456 RepID=UPI00339689CE